MKTTTRVHQRFMIRRDMPSVLEIESSQFHAWDEAEFLRVLRQRNCIGMVAEHGEKILGFMIYGLEKGHLDLVKLVVHPAYRKQGIGSQMIAKLVGKLSSHRPTRITLVVRESDLRGQLFLRSQGFRASDVFREHYENGEDGYVFGYHLTNESAPVRRKEVAS